MFPATLTDLRSEAAVKQSDPRPREDSPFRAALVTGLGFVSTPATPGGAGRDVTDPGAVA